MLFFAETKIKESTRKTMHPVVEVGIWVVDLMSTELMVSVGVITLLMTLSVANMKPDLHMRTKSPENLTSKINHMKKRESLIETYREIGRENESEDQEK